MTGKRYTIQTGSNNPILRTVSEEIEKIDEELFLFAQDLVRVMYRNKWVWLAAPQVGQNIRMIATTQRGEKKWKDVIIDETIMINPNISWTSADCNISEEACISLPDERGNVRRHRSIVVEYTDLKGHKQKKKFKDFNATIIQHEIDHLDGILFTDKLVKGRK